MVTGHSAGAAVLARMCLDGAIAPRCLVGINGAFLPFEGIAGALFPPMAKLMALNPFSARLLAWSADETAVARLIRSTGSRLDRRGLDLYRRLLASPQHVSGALQMMANWDLDRLADDMRKLAMPVRLLVGSEDKAVPPASASEVVARLAQGKVEILPALGHLAHEEAPDRVAERLIAYGNEIRPAPVHMQDSP